MTDSKLRNNGYSPIGFAHAFSFYAYLKWFTRQESSNNSTNHESELFAWAVQSLNMTMLVSIVVCVVVLLDENALSIWRSISSWPKFVLFGWSYPIMLYVNYRVLISGGAWRRIVLKMDVLSARKRQLGHLAVLAMSIAIFGGSFSLAFAIMRLQ